MHQCKIANVEDFNEMYDMALKFAQEYSPYWNEDTVRAIVETFVLGAEDRICIICPGKGMIAAIVNPFVLDHTKRMCTEIAWWVEPEYRGTAIGAQLLVHLMNWAKTVDCDLLTMVCLDDELGKYYESKGFKLYERAYMKEL